MVIQPAFKALLKHIENPKKGLNFLILPYRESDTPLPVKY